MTPPLDPRTVVQRAPDLLGGAIDGQMVLLSAQHNDYFSMNQVGSRIWALIEAPIQVARLVDQLVEEFDVDRTACERDVLGFLTELHRAGLVTSGPAA
jgi:hypothetical protein